MHSFYNVHLYLYESSNDAQTTDILKFKLFTLSHLTRCKNKNNSLFIYMFQVYSKTTLIVFSICLKNKLTQHFVYKITFFLTNPFEKQLLTVRKLIRI